MYNISFRVNQKKKRLPAASVVLILKCHIRIHQMNDRHPVMFLEVQRGQLIVAGNNTNYLQTAPAIILRERCDTQRLLLATASPTGTEFEKYRDSPVILGRDFPAVTVH